MFIKQVVASNSQFGNYFIRYYSEWMRKSFQQLQENLKFDELMKFLDERFQLFPDHRAINAQYSLASVSKAAFPMFSLKSSSLLDFKRQTIAEESNLRSIYRIVGAIPGDTQMREILDNLEPVYVRNLFGEISKLVTRAGVFKKYRFWEKGCSCRSME